jgi:hypothetical protein
MPRSNRNDSHFFELDQNPFPGCRFGRTGFTFYAWPTPLSRLVPAGTCSMQLFCQACQSAFAGVSHCPKCGGRLLAPQESFIFSGSPKDPPKEMVPPTLTGRIAVGLGVGFGLYMGLRELASAGGLLSSGGPADGAIDFAFRLVSLLAGAILAGAGRDQGLSAGFGVGVVGSGLLLAADVYMAGAPTAAGWVAPAAAGVIALLAAPAGVVGAVIWPPLTELPQVTLVTTASSRGSSLSRLVEETADRDKPRPTLWLRILVGAVIAAAGLLLSEDIRLWLARGSGGLLQTGGNHRGPTVGFQIAVFLLGLGGMLSAAGSGAGFRHGLLTGILTAVGVYIAVSSRPDNPFPAIDGYFVTFDRKAEPIVSDKGAAAEVLGLILGLCTAGGWLGGQLFPPLVPKALRGRRRLPHQT